MTATYSSYDHHDPNITLDSVYRTWNELRAQCPIGRSDAHGGMWVVTGYPEAVEIMTNPEVFSSWPTTIPAWPQAAPMVPVEIDPPNHSRYRALVQAPFSPPRAHKLAEPLRALVNDLIDEFIEDGRCDVFQTIAARVPTVLATTMLGTPVEDAPKLQDWADKIIHVGGTDAEIAGRAVMEVYQYFFELLEARRADPSGDDLMSVLVRARVDGEGLNEDELMGFCLFLLVASVDTSQKAFGSIFWQLATDPDLRHQITADPDSRPAVIEEFLRYWAPVINARRVTRDTTLGGVDMKEGERVLILLGAANRDEREFSNANEFIADRSPNRHVTFTSGIHRCLGAHIARVELRVILDEFLRRIPHYEIEDESAIVWSSGQVQGVVKLPIRFAPGPKEHWSVKASGDTILS